MDARTLKEALQSDFRDAVIASCLVDDEHRQLLIDHVAQHIKEHSNNTIYFISHLMWWSWIVINEYGLPYNHKLNEYNGVKKGISFNVCVSSQPSGITERFYTHTGIYKHHDRMIINDSFPCSEESVRYAIEQALLYIAKEENLL